jgi:hypothetical protein
VAIGSSFGVHVDRAVPGVSVAMKKSPLVAWWRSPVLAR